MPVIHVTAYVYGRFRFLGTTMTHNYIILINGTYSALPPPMMMNLSLEY
jgi:hypothetical protein